MLLQEMPNPARIKLKLIIRSAGTPSESMVSEALNILSSCVGKSWKIRSPTCHDADGIGDRVA